MNKHTTAAQNLKAKMKSIQTINATEATAQAIAGATESIDLTKSRDLNANLRLKNLEKQVRKQDQRINEKFKNLQANKTEEKNFSGSYTEGSVASPAQQTLPHHKNKKQKGQTKIIDLSNEDTDNNNYNSQTPKTSLRHKQLERKQK